MSDEINIQIIEETINVQALKETINMESIVPVITKFINLLDTPNAYEEGKFLKATASGLVFATPAGGGDMLKATYDINENGIVDKIDGGTW